MGNIKELYKNTWAIEDFGVRIFLLEGSEKTLVIDTGISGLDIHKIAQECTDKPLVLLNTHADMDHIAGNDAFSSFYMHPSEAIVYYHISHRHGNMIPVFDGDVIDLGNRSVTVVHVPGHTPGSITVLDKEERCLIGGDPIQEGGDIYMFGLHREMNAYIAGLSRLLKRSEEFDFIYPSHAKEKVGKEIIGKLIDGAKDILEGKIPGTETEVHGHQILSYAVGSNRFLCDK